jgi:hypothetical protein
LNNVGRAVFNTLTGSQGVEQMTDPNLIRKFLTSPVLKQGSPYAQYDNLTKKDLLIDYLVDNRIPIDGRKNPWKTINNNIDADFIDEVRRRQGFTGKGLTGVAAPLSSYTGKCVGCPCFISNRTTDATSYAAKPLRRCGGGIIQFLSSDSRELIKKLDIMLAEIQAGNNNVFNHISAIVDELHRQGMLSINEIKKLYNSFK